MDIGKQQRVIMVEPIGLTLNEELEVLAGDGLDPAEVAERADPASGDPLE